MRNMKYTKMHLRVCAHSRKKVGYRVECERERTQFSLNIFNEARSRDTSESIVEPREYTRAWKTCGESPLHSGDTKAGNCALVPYFVTHE